MDCRSFLLNILFFISSASIIGCATHIETAPIEVKRTYPTLTEKPSPIELTKINKLVDNLLAGYENSDQKYVKELNKTKWGEIFAMNALSSSSNFPKFRAANKRARIITQTSFARRAKIRKKFLAELSKSESKSELAIELKKEYLKISTQSEAGLESIDKNMLATSLIKFDLIDQQLDVLTKLKGKYKQTEAGKVTIGNDVPKNLTDTYLELMTKFDDATATQKELGQLLIKQFDDLQIFIIELTK